MDVRTAWSSESCSALGLDASWSVSAVTVSVAARGAVVSCASSTVAASVTSKVVINRRTAVMQVLPNTGLLRKDEALGFEDRDGDPPVSAHSKQNPPAPRPE